MSSFPPSHLLLLEEANRLSASSALPRLFADRAFRRDLLDQVNATLVGSDYERAVDHNARQFVVSLGAAANPLDPSAKCGAAACREELVRVMSRTSCIYADRVLVPDSLTPLLLSYIKDPTDPNLQLALTAFAALREMKPLVEGGAISIAPPSPGLCDLCDAELVASVDSVVDEVTGLVVDSITDGVLQRMDDRDRDLYVLILRSPLLKMDGFGIGLGPEIRIKNGPSGPVAVTAEEARAYVRADFDSLADYVRNELKKVGGDLRASADSKATLTTNFMLSAIGARAIQRRPIGAEQLTEFERTRSLRLPWFEHLTSEEVLRLRERAASALPAFRAQVGRALTAGDGAATNDGAIASVVADLRQQTQEVETELKAAASAGGAAKTAILTGLSFTVGIFGAYQALSSGNLPVAIGAVTAALAAAHAAEKRLSDSRACHERLAAHPGYVLLTAERVSEHAD